MTNGQQQPPGQQEAFEEFLQEFARFSARAKDILGQGTSTEDIRSLYASWRIDSRNGNPYGIPKNGKNGHAAQPHAAQPHPAEIADAPPPAAAATNGYTKPAAAAAEPLTPGSGIGKPPRAEPRPHRAGNGGDATPAQRFAYGLAREIAKQRKGVTWKDIMDAYCAPYNVHRFEDVGGQDLSDILDEMKRDAGRE